MAYSTATLTGTYLKWNGDPAQGVVEIIPNSRSLVDAEGDVILSGRVKVTLDEDGVFSIDLPATDDETVEPATGRQYAVVAKLRHQHLPVVTGVELATGETVDMADITEAAETAATVSVWLTQEEYEADRAAVEADAATDATTKAAAAQAAAVQRANHTGSQAISTVTGLQTALDKRAELVTIDDLPTTGILSFHRGAGNGSSLPIAPENSMSAFRQAVALGAHIIDLDCHALSDGTLVALHDATVDRTTASTGAASLYTSMVLPKIHMPESVGVGWDAEPTPTIEEILREFGGRVILTIEFKGGLSTNAGIDRIAALIHKYGLERSVLINTSSAATATYITGTAGCLAHVYTVTTSQGITDAATAGASLIEIPYNAAGALVTAAQNSGIHRFIAGPIYTRTMAAGLTSGIQGYVTDAPGYTGRSTGAARSAPSLAPAVAAARRGAGWAITGSLSPTSTTWLTTAGIKLRDGASGVNTYRFGDISGTAATTGTITFKFKMTTLPSNTTQRVFARVLCPEENGTAADGDTRGYVISLRANGNLNLWTSPVGFGAGTGIGGTPLGSTALVAGTECTLTFEWTATQIRLTNVNTAETTGWVTNSDWRGDYHYAGTTMTDGVSVVTDLAIT